MKLCFIDLETTGLDNRIHAIVQIAGLIKTKDHEQEFSFNVRPFKGDMINNVALKTNKLTVEQIAKFEEPQKVYGALVNTFSAYVDKYKKTDKMFFVAYNARFDYDFMRTFWERNNDTYFGSYFWFPPLDVMTLALSKLMVDRPKLPNFKLGTVANHLGLDYDESISHEAIYDVRITKRLYNIVRG